MKRSVTLLLIFMSHFLAFGQYGNEWINYTQTYFKFKVADQGVYQIDYQVLSDAGVPVSSIDPRNIQLFLNGEEQYLRVEGETDGSFDPGDYIEFYGVGNDGSLDQVLYGSSTEQTNPYVSLYSDTSIYFLTWSSSTPGKRFSLNSDVDYAGLTPDQNFQYESVYAFRDQWLDGLPYADLGYLSEYTLGEGYLSGNIASNPRKWDVPSPHYDSSGPQPTVSFLGFGESNPGIYDGDGNNHVFEVTTVNGVDEELLLTHKHRGFSSIRYTDVEVPKRLIGDKKTRFKFASVYGGMGRHALAWIKLSYPRKYNMDGQAFLFNDPGTNNYIRFAGYPSGKTQPLIYNLKAGTQYTGTINGNVLEYKKGNGESGSTYITDASLVKQITALQAVNFVGYSTFPTDRDYLIISHSSLASSVQEYISYRSSVQGGGHRIALANADELYDEFYFGQHHPMALRNWIYYMMDRQSTKPDYLLLLGKGQMYINIRFDAINRDQGDLVPTMGWPPTDYLYTSPLDMTDLKPELATGRIPANTNDEVRNYLNKVKEYELLPIRSKRVLQLAGGVSAAENLNMESYLRQFGSIISSDSFGGSTIMYSKRSSTTIDESLIDKITGTVNDGVTMVNYFGHGAASVTEIDFGKVQNYQNQGKYPLYFFDGCILGNSFDRGQALLEEFLFEPNKGAIGWVAGTFYGYQNELFAITKSFHEQAFRNHYGASIGAIMQEAIDDYQDVNNLYSVTHSRVMILHGDPAIRMYSPNLPDYTCASEDIELIDDRNSIDSFEIRFTMKNLGKVTYDTVTCVLSITNSGNITYLDTLHINPFAAQRVVNVKISRAHLNGGLNTVQLHIDPLNAIAEYAFNGETNNLVSRQHFVISSKLDILSPTPDQIVSKSTLRLKFTNYEVPKTSTTYQILLDTVPTFNSPMLSITSHNRTEILSEVDLALPPVHKVDYFLTIVNTKTGDSSHTTFSYIYNEFAGQSQGYWTKFKESENDDIYINPSDRSFNFGRVVSSNIVMGTSGTGITLGYGYQYGRLLYYGQLNYKPGLVVFAVDPKDESRYREHNQFNVISGNPWDPNDLFHEYYGKDSFSCLYRFNTNLQVERDSFVAFLNRIPDGFYLGIYNETTTGIEQWEDTVFTTLEKFGATDIRNLKENQPYILWGIKGMAPGEATEVFADFSNEITPPERQYIEFSTTIYPLKKEGVLDSRIFGPSSKWVFAKLDLTGDNPADLYIPTIIGFDSAQKPVNLIVADTNATEIDLTSIDASLYPYLRLQLKLIDEENRTPMHLNRWSMLFEGYPEGFAYQEDNENDTIHEGDFYSFKVVYMNTSEMNMDSIQVTHANYHGTQKLNDNTRKLRSLNAGDTLNYVVSRDRVETTGDNSTIVFFNPNYAQPEQTVANNGSVRDLYVIPNTNTPVIEVYFDHQQILNGQVINPNAHVSILGRSNHQNMLINSPELFMISIKKVGGSSENVYDSIFQFTEESAQSPSKFDFDLNNLEAGKYLFLSRLMSPTMSEDSKEASYTIEFEISDKNEITELLPYPNPMVNQCRFAYTYGGRDLPNKYHLSIFNINGKLVREIDQDEFGPLRYGTQLSDFAFDGTDEFGDQLANGVYLYRFEIQDAEKKTSGADQYMKGGYGKIYLSR